MGPYHLARRVHKRIDLARRLVQDATLVTLYPPRRQEHSPHPSVYLRSASAVSRPCIRPHPLHTV